MDSEEIKFSRALEIMEEKARLVEQQLQKTKNQQQLPTVTETEKSEEKKDV